MADFENRYEQKAHLLKKRFEIFLEAAAECYSDDGKKSLPVTDWGETIQKLLCVFQNLKTPAKKEKPANNIYSMLDSFIIFKQVCKQTKKNQ